MIDFNTILSAAIANAIETSVAKATEPLLARIDALEAKLREAQHDTAEILVPISSSVSHQPPMPLLEYLKQTEFKVAMLTNEVESLQEGKAGAEAAQEYALREALREAVNNLDLSDLIREKVEELDITNKMKAAMEDLISDEVESQLSNLDIDDMVEDTLSRRDYVDRDELSEAVQSEVREMFSNGVQIRF